MRIVMIGAGYVGLVSGACLSEFGHEVVCVDNDPARIDALNKALRPLYNREGSGWITATTLDNRPVLRVTMMNARTGAEHVRALLDGLVSQAAKIESA